LNLLVENYDETASPAGHIGTGGNLSLTTGGNLTADFASIAVNNRGGGVIDSGVTLTVNIGGALTTLQNGLDFLGNTESLSLAISSRFDNNTAGSFIGGDATLLFQSDSVSIGGFLSVLIGDRGGTIDGNALLNFNVTHDITVQSDAAWQILNDSGTDLNAASPIGGTIHGNATLELSAANLTVPAGLLDVSILNKNGGVVGSGGTIDSDANITFTLSGNLTTSGSASFTILNRLQIGGTGGTAGTTGGTIGGNATINLSAANLTADSLFVNINNRNDGVVGSGGAIDSNATINFNTGNLTTQTGTTFFILNSPPPGRTASRPIGGDGTIKVTAPSISPRVDSLGSSLHVRIGNESGGNIGGNAIVNFGASDITNALGAATFEIDNSNGGTIGGNGTVSVSASNDINIVGDATFQILNNDAGHIGGDANILVTTGAGGDLTANSVLAFVNNHNGGSIDSGANITFNMGGALTTTGDATFGISNLNDGNAGGTIGSLATVDLNAASISVGGFFQTFVSTNGGGSIQGDAINTVIASGDLTAQQGILLSIPDTIFGSTGNFTGGHIGGNAIVTLTAQNIITPSTNSGTPGVDLMAIEASIYPNTGGTVGGDAIVNVSASQDISAPGSVLFWVANGNYQNLGPGMIGGNAEVNVSASNISTGDFFDQILNYGGASIGGHAAINLTADTLSVGGNLDSRIDNTSGGIIGGANLSFNLTGDLTSATQSFLGVLNSGGSIGSNINVTLNLAGTLTTQSSADFVIFNYDDGSGSGPGTIGGDAIVNVSAANANINASNVGVSPAFGGGEIFNFDGGTIGGNATIIFSLTGDLTTHGDNFFRIVNYGGMISSDATINVSAANISALDGTLTAGYVFDYIDNSSGGSIGGNASVNFNLTGDLTTQGAGFPTFFAIFNGGGTIAGSATVNVTAANITEADSLVTEIDNTGGSIGAATEGGATINMNVSGTATVTNDATVAIYGSDGAVGGAAININGGNYNVGGTFLTYIDQDGTITFNNATAHADVLKVGALGTNGVLRIGGGMLSADTTLELYASGSNGQLNFVSNVTLGGNSAKILAANSVTIFDNIVVTIGGPNPAQVYTNNANYTGFGGNGTTTGTFAGAGANNPLPLDQAPPFGPARRAVRPRDIVPSGRTTGGTINVNNTAELLAMLDGAVVGPDGRITIPDSKSATSRRDANQTNINRLSRLEHQLSIQRIRDRGITRVGGGKLAAAQ